MGRCRDANFVFTCGTRGCYTNPWCHQWQQSLPSKWSSCFCRVVIILICSPWWRHQMETFSALLVTWAMNSPVTGEFPAQRPVTRSFDFFFDLHLNKRSSKQWWRWWFETPARPLWRQCNDLWHHKLLRQGYRTFFTWTSITQTSPTRTSGQRPPRPSTTQNISHTFVTNAR